MNKLKYLILLAGLVFAFNSCEKDDICVDGDTPLLVIRFYDATITTDLKAPSNLLVKGLLDSGEYGDIITNVGTDSIQIPLRIASLSTTYNLSTNATTDTENANEDILVFDYTTKEVFVSRACGYVVNYEELTDELTTDTDNWIKDIEIINTTVEDQTTAHVKIYH
ncbi:DUF6452 family protein [Cellulophaga sp. L1A9]|uniref:DUF6452 family protein n=1 Tax=Cellulophaga sp. L1A9 TaxID=2686362 RepID=UPI00131C16F9|nr:DUF6452 family protein [Cellulophaga sp. L1A9]